jgi:putative Ca2+/H+ antiporter (TMEM165/GDT1 family)
VDGFLLALLLVFTLAIGGRDQWMVAHWADSLGKTAPLLIVAAMSSCLAAAAMGWIGARFAALLPQRAGQMLVAFALGMAAVELAWPVRLKSPREPTRSLPAILLVLLARQIGDGARFAIVAIAAWTSAPVTTAFGGALGGVVAVALGWSGGGEALTRWPLRAVRLVLATGLFVAALFIGLDARFGI